MIAPSEQDLLDWAAAADDRQWHDLLLLVSTQLDHGAREPTGLARVAVRLAHQGRDARAGQLLRAVTSIGPIRWCKDSLSHSVLRSLRNPGSPWELLGEHSAGMDRSDVTRGRSARVLSCVGLLILFGRWEEARRVCSRLCTTISKRQIVDYLVMRILRPQVHGLVDALGGSGDGDGQMLGSSASCADCSLYAAIDQYGEPIGDDRLPKGWGRGRSLGPSRQSRWPDGAF